MRPMDRCSQIHTRPRDRIRHAAYRAPEIATEGKAKEIGNSQSEPVLKKPRASVTCPRQARRKDSQAGPEKYQTLPRSARDHNIQPASAITPRRISAFDRDRHSQAGWRAPPPECFGFVRAILIHLISIPVTNTSVNPALSTGVSLFEGGWAIQQLWLFWLAPIAGAVIGAVTYTFISKEEK